MILPFLLLFGCGGGGGGGGSSEDGTIHLAWDTSSHGVVVYRVYYGSSSQVYDKCVDIPNTGSETVTYRLSDLVKGKTYYIAVTARGSGYDESGFSNEISAVAQ